MSVNNRGELFMVSKLLMVSSKPLQCKDRSAKDQSINWVCLDLGTRLLWRADQTRQSPSIDAEALTLHKGFGRGACQ